MRLELRVNPVFFTFDWLSKYLGDFGWAMNKVIWQWHGDLCVLIVMVIMCLTWIVAQDVMIRYISSGTCDIGWDKTESAVRARPTKTAQNSTTKTRGSKSSIPCCEVKTVTEF